jgi:Protein of unknown function (DUF1194)
MLNRDCRGLLLATVIVMGMFLPVNKAVAENVAVDLELVLAVDISLSMDEDELKLQRDGYIAAFRNPEIIEAIKSGPTGRIAATYVEWAGQSFQRIIVPWTLIEDVDTALPFADKLAAAPVAATYRTSISGALKYAIRLFDDNGYQGGRQVIDISGDGPNNQGIGVEIARDEAVSKGITINGLPLLLKPGTSSFEPAKLHLEDYYEDCVIGGTGAFTIVVRGRSEFVPAIRRKLLLEVAGLVPTVIKAAVAPARRSDCLIGEKIWNEWMDRYRK